MNQGSGEEALDTCLFVELAPSVVTAPAPPAVVGTHGRSGSLAQETDARIILLHVLEALLDEVTPRTRNMAVLAYLRELEDALARLMAAVPDDARTWSHPVERVARGRAYREILAIAEAERASSIVMGVRGRGALNRLFFGSTTEYVIREARCAGVTLHSEVASKQSEPVGKRPAVR